DLTAGVSLWGACAGAHGTVLDGAANDVVVIVEGQSEVRSLTLAHARVALYAGSAARLTLEGVIIDGPGGQGLAVDAGGRATVRADHIRLTGNEGAGMLIESPSTTATISDAVIRDTRSSTSSATGNGLFIARGANVDATAIVLSRNGTNGVLVTRAAAALHSVV